MQHIGARYEVRDEHALGQGGSAVVHRAFDTVSGREVALKQLLVDEHSAQYGEAVALFEREYHTLGQLLHPYIIQVYDYGVEQGRPYYTMELLSGQDLRELAPLPWRRVCGLLRDVSTALALLHSRRLVHRDVSSGNVRCTRSGAAKLLDFGTMIPMGVAEDAVGTPPFVSPEALRGEALDARADLYALGALAYWLLLKRHAYPANDLSDLTDLWRSRPVDPHRLDPQIPQHLSELVISLLSLDRSRRPASAGEVVERLTAIAGLTLDDGPELRAAFLQTPKLVGRDRAVAELRKRLMQVTRGRGACLLIEGEPGMGRSRLLDRCVLEGQVVNTLPLRVDAAHARTGDYALLRAIAHELLQLTPERAMTTAERSVGVLGHALPELWERLGKPQLTSFASRHEQRPALQRALREWFVELSERRPLLIAVDDIHLGDEPSVSALALIARVTRGCRICVAVTAPPAASEERMEAMAALRRGAETVRLSPLRDVDTRVLVESVFGAGPSVSALGGELHRLSEGNPGVCMALCQHLVDERVVVHTRGEWQVPTQLPADALPRSLAHAYQTRLSTLSEDALALAQALHLSNGQLALPDYLALTDHGELSRLYTALDELLWREVLVGSGRGYGFRHPGFAKAVGESLSSERRHELERRVSRQLAARGEHAVLVAYHLLAASAPDEAIDCLVRYTRSEEAQQLYLDPACFPYARSTFEGAIEAAARLGRSETDTVPLHLFLVGLSMFIDPVLAQQHGPSVEASLQRATGLSHWSQTDSRLPTVTRIGQCLEHAQQVWTSTPQAQRALDPLEALQTLGQYVLFAVGPCATMLDAKRIEALTALIEPFTGLAPALELIRDVAVATRDITLALDRRAEQGFRRILTRLSQPGGVGLPEFLHRPFRLAMLYALGVACVARTAPEIEHWITELDTDPLQQANAWRLRRLMHLYRGELLHARNCAERIETLVLENAGVRTLDGGTAYAEMRIAVLLGDVAEVRRSVGVIGAFAERYPVYAGLERCAQGAYLGLCGDLQGAMRELELGLAGSRPEAHIFWPTATDDYLKIRHELDGAENVAPLAEQALRQAEAAALDARPTLYLSALLALCEAELGDTERGLERIKTTLQAAQAEGHAPLQMAELYLRAAKTALVAKHDELFAQYARDYAMIAQSSAAPALQARYEALMQAAHGAELMVGEELLAFGSDVTQKLGAKRRRMRSS